MVKTTLSQSFYKYEALLQEKEVFGPWCFDDIESKWGKMLFNGATSFWETERGGWDFTNAGSLCHGWSAIPIYFYYTYLLGVKPIKPGFKEFLVDPVIAGINKRSGSIPTPYGNIEINLETSAKGIEGVIEYPEGTKPVINSDKIKLTLKVKQKGSTL